MMMQYYTSMSFQPSLLVLYLLSVVIVEMIVFLLSLTWSLYLLFYSPDTDHHEWAIHQMTQVH